MYKIHYKTHYRLVRANSYLEDLGLTIQTIIMKRYGFLYDKIYSINNLKLAHKNASKGKKRYREVIAVNKELETHLVRLHKILKYKTFTNSLYEVFIRNDKGKEREIYKLPYFPDRIIHHAIMQILEPIWKPTLIADTFQSIKGRGVHQAKRKIIKALRNNSELNYYLQIDIKKFYPSINNSILKNVLRKKIKCRDTLWLLSQIINSTKGVPIGNYLSQYFGNLYLGELDNFIKGKKVKHYYRYCDDIVILGTDKDSLKNVFTLLYNYITIQLQLQIKKSWKLREINNHGINFLGFIIFKNKILLRKKIVKGYKKSLKIGNPASIASYKGWLMAGNCYNLKQRCESNA